MLRHSVIIFALVLCLFSASAHAQSLSQILDSAQTGALENRLARSDIQLAQDQLNAAKAKTGLQLFAAAGWARNKDVITDSSTLTYQTATAQIGLSLPVLGSAEKQQQQVHDAELELKLAAIKRQGMARTVEELVLQANATVASADARIAIEQAFLSCEPDARTILQSRERDHLLLASDQLDFLSMFDLARRELEKDRQTRDSALAVMAQLSGQNMARFSPLPPRLRISNRVLSHLDDTANEYPGVRIARAILDQRLRDVQLTQWAGVEANIALAQNSNRGIGVPSGSATTLGIQITMPLDFRQEHDALRDAARQQADKARLGLEQALRQYQRRARDLLGQTEVESQDLVSARRQIEAADAAWVIAHRRAQFMDGDVLEKELQARYALFQAALRLSRSEQNAAYTTLDIACLAGAPDQAMPQLVSVAPPAVTVQASRGHAGNETVSAHMPGVSASAPDHIFIQDLSLALSLQAAPKATSVAQEIADFSQNWTARTERALQTPLALRRVDFTPSGMGWYVWKGEYWLSHPDLSRTLPTGSNSILLSFKAATLNDLAQSARVQTTMRSLINALHARGLRVVWLVGDPNIVFQEGRTQLLRWLPWMAAVGFDGVNLDVERNELPAAKRGAWTAGLIHTLFAQRAQSTLPIALTLNWREVLEPGLVTSLRQAGLGEIDAMLYVSNLQRTEQLAEQVLAAAPDLSVCIVQSIEPQLPITESTANLGQQASLVRWREVAATLAQQNNFRGIMVQSWEDFQNMKP